MDSKAFFFFAFRFWPGFQKLWTKGDFHSLLVSLLFSWFFAIAWLGTFVWPEWLVALFSPVWLAKAIFYGLWLAIASMSVLSATGSFLGLSRPGELGVAERQENLGKAQELYLQANYFDAERLVRNNMFGVQEDVESLLLWIAILRRTRRISLALELIAQVDKLDVAAPWQAELRNEKEQCLRIKIQTPPAHD